METIAPRGRFTGPILPRFILEMEITVDAKMLYALLCDFAGDKDHCWPSQTRLAGMLSCSVSSVKKYLRELEARDLISIRRGSFHASTYFILRPKNAALFSRPQEPKFAYPQANSGYDKNFKKKDNYPPTPTPQNAKEPPSISGPRCGRGDFFSANSAFESFWAAYPKKEAKELARSVWHRLWRQGAISVAALVEALRRFCGTDSWNREHGRYVPQLANWLKGRRWLDEAPESVGETLPPAEQARHEEARRRNKLFAEQEKRRNAYYQAETAQLRPAFEKFLACFPEGTENPGPAWGLWNLLHRKGQAPSAADVSDASLSPFAFLNQWRMTHGLAR